MKILFDATIFAEGLRKTAGRSGMFWAAYEIFRELSLRDDVELGIYASASAVDPVNAFFDQHFPGRGYIVLNAVRSSLIGRLWWWISGLSGGRLLKTAQTTVKIFRVLANKHWHSDRVTEIADGFDIFFSPVYLAPHPIRKHSRVARVTYVHDTIPKLFPQYSVFTRLGFSWNFDLLDGLTERDWCCANSECTKRDFLRFSPRLKPEHVFVAPLAADGKFHPVDDPKELAHVRRKYGIPADKRYFLSLCNIAPHKNLPLAIAAFRCFAQNHRDFVFVLAGGKYSLYSFGGNGDDVLRIGYVDDADLAALYSGSAAFVYLSQYEGFGLPLLEAMQCGAPVITSNVSSIPEVVADDALTIDPADKEAAVAAMSRLADDEGLRADYRERGLRRSQLFSWRRTGEVVAATCRAALAEASQEGRLT